MTRSEIENRIYSRLGKNRSSVDSTTQTRIREFVSERHRRLLRMPGLTHLMDDTATFASVANQSRYALVNLASVQEMRDLTNDRTLDPMSRTVYRAINPDPSAARGLPTHYVFLGYEPVAKQPANASSLFVKSTSASDTQVAYVECDITDGYPRTVSVTLTGTTAVDVSTALTSAIRIRKFYLASAAAGVVTLHEDSGSGTELARIGIGQTSQKYWVCDLHPQPSAVNTYELDVTLAITDLAQDTDEPRLHEEFHYLLVLGGCMDELTKSDDARYAVVKSEYDDGIKDLEYWIARQAASHNAPARAFSSLGAQFPSGI